MGKRLVKVPGDGRCFFRVILRQLKPNLKNDPEIILEADKMRADVIEALRKDPVMVVCSRGLLFNDDFDDK